MTDSGVSNRRSAADVRSRIALLAHPPIRREAFSGFSHCWIPPELCTCGPPVLQDSLPELSYTTRVTSWKALHATNQCF